MIHDETPLPAPCRVPLALYIDDGLCWAGSLRERMDSWQNQRMNAWQNQSGIGTMPEPRVETVGEAIECMEAICGGIGDDEPNRRRSYLAQCERLAKASGLVNEWRRIRHSWGY